MKTSRRTAVIAGVLIIVGTVAGLLSVVPSVEGPDCLEKVSESTDQVLKGAFFQFLMVPAYVGFALALYPILRKYSVSLSLGFVGFRIIAEAFQIIGVVLLLLFLPLSQEFVIAGAPGSSYFQTLGGLLREGRDLVNHVALFLALSIGDLMLYYILYRSKLVPRWLSVWGVIGVALAISASLLIMFRFIDVVTPTYITLILPWGLQQIVLAAWLIIKGFNPSATVFGTAKADPDGVQMSTSKV
ncbi:DUF4386 domain-containing protein [Rubrobacter aplysinae]|uniref:DUF4386 domain-containing protein n=1 Tax=Rubrobacter aplysinae TaxID=909625 RepID=UPI00064B97A3|nr:DUF4386 domain-containing protein [Rubrobacter aplysinae]